MTEAVHRVPAAAVWSAFVVGAAAIALPILLSSGTGFGASQLAVVVIGILIVIVGAGLRYLQTHPELPVTQFSDATWSIIVLSTTLVGLLIVVVNMVTMQLAPNTVDQFIGVKDRTPVTVGPTQGVQVFFVLVGLVVLFAAARMEQHSRYWISALVTAVYRMWTALSRVAQFRLTVVILVVLMLFNILQVLRVPFTYTGSWDEIAAVYRGSKEEQLQVTLDGLQAGCLLCTPDHAPIENVTTGDDIGLFFMFGVVSKLGLPATLTGYQFFIALTIGLIILVSSLAVMIGYRSFIAGVIFALLITLLDTITVYQSLLITSYWSPAGAGILSAGLALAVLGRLALDKASSAQPSIRFYAFMFAIWGLAAGWAYLARSSGGYTTVFSALVTGLVLVIQFRGYVKWLPTVAAFAIGLAIPVGAFNFALNWRIGAYNLSAPIHDTMTSHPFSHAVYVGLGYVVNDWGIRWDDRNGQQHASVACPEAQYLGPEYYACISKETINIALKDPNLYVRNIAVKAESILQTTFSHLSFALWLPIVLVLLRRPAVYLVLGLMLIFSLIPSLLSVPYFGYLQGYGEILLAFLAAALIDFFMRLKTEITSVENKK